MAENKTNPLDEEAEEVRRERDQEPPEMRRTTEQGDDLTELHSVHQRQSRAKVPYRPPRQPSQDPPG